MRGRKCGRGTKTESRLDNAGRLFRRLLIKHRIRIADKIRPVHLILPAVGRILARVLGIGFLSGPINSVARGFFSTIVRVVLRGRVRG